MTTLQQSQPQIICYEIWEMEDGIHGSLITHKPWWQITKDHPVCFNIRGKTIHFVLVSEDLSITRKAAQDFAIAVFENRVKRISVDLTPCQPNRKK